MEPMEQIEQVCTVVACLGPVSIGKSRAEQSRAGVLVSMVGWLVGWL